MSRVFNRSEQIGSYYIKIICIRFWALVKFWAPESFWGKPNSVLFRLSKLNCCARKIKLWRALWQVQVAEQTATLAWLHVRWWGGCGGGCGWSQSGSSSAHSWMRCICCLAEHLHREPCEQRALGGAEHVTPRVGWVVPRGCPPQKVYVPSKKNSWLHQGKKITGRVSR